ncbi:MAG: hypothetical protein NZT92_22860 [Abditibacteriales bacterium]|nr:hypothetical protein [Abditibacteriales bacterium]MDW8365021.1 hypothetical protein [Abditibacteriales bacterium]
MKHGKCWSWMVALGLIACSAGEGSEPSKPLPREASKPPQATVRTVQRSKDKTIAEIVLKGRVVITIEAWAGGQSPEVRAERVAQRLNEALELGATHQTFKIEAPHFEEAIVAFGRPIITATFEDQWGTSISRHSLIRQWHRNLVAALRLSEPQTRDDIVLLDEPMRTDVPLTFDAPPLPPSNDGKTVAPSRAKPKPPAAARSSTKKARR